MEVRIDPMKAICIDQKIGDLDQPSHCCISPDPFSFTAMMVLMIPKPVPPIAQASGQILFC
jgi:hypothetical protein